MAIKTAIDALNILVQKDERFFIFLERVVRDGWSQDLIDEILALVGWEFEVFNFAQTKPPYYAWSFRCWERKDYHVAFEPVTASHGSVPGLPDKLSAAKAALIAVVEHLEKARG